MAEGPVISLELPILLALFAFGVFSPEKLAQLLLDPFDLWWSALFDGVPHDAKTLGQAYWMVKSVDPGAQYCGATLWQGAKAGRVISEPGHSISFEAIAGAVTSSIFTVGNYTPHAAHWRPGQHGPGFELGFIFGPVPPPHGSPYNQSTELGEFHMQRPLSKAAYKAKYGIDEPTGKQLKAFLESGYAPRWTDLPPERETFLHQYERWFELAFKFYKLWLEGKPNPHGSPPTGSHDGDPLIAIRDCICIELVPVITNISTSFGLLDQVLQSFLALMTANGPVEIIAELHHLRECICADLNKLVGIEMPKLEGALARIAAAAEKSATAMDTPAPKGLRNPTSAIAALAKFYEKKGQLDPTLGQIILS
jgi:hypothetical protein